MSNFQGSNKRKSGWIVRFCKVSLSQNFFDPGNGNAKMPFTTEKRYVEDYDSQFL